MVVALVGDCDPHGSALRAARPRFIITVTRRAAGDEEWRAQLVEMAIGIALVVISAIEIYGIVRVVSSNLNIGR